MVIDPGIYWVKGVNGSGKSTLLKTIAGILYFDGDILLNKNISLKNNPTSYRKLVNFAEAEPIFPSFLTGKEMIKLFASAKNASVGQECYYIESMRMEHYVNEPLSSYSSGMLKKLSLVLAFLGKPEIILLDEPLITLDKESLPILYKWIAEKYTTQNTNFLLSSHQPLTHESLPGIKEILVEQKTLTINA